MTTIEETLVLVKPDGVARGLTGEILRRIEAKGYALVDLKLVEADRELLARHYAEHQGKPFYEPLVEFMESGPIVAIRVAGNRVIEGFRSLAGATDPTTAAPGTIRGDLARDWGLPVQQNLVHGSILRSPPPASSRSGSRVPFGRQSRRRPARTSVALGAFLVPKPTAGPSGGAQPRRPSGTRWESTAPGSGRRRPRSRSRRA
jgi:nucleoside-diphosphate kinase